MSTKAMWWSSFYTVFVIGYLVCMLYYGIRDPAWLVSFVEGAIFLYVLPKVVRSHNQTRETAKRYRKESDL